jgi:hypothetical protein
MRKQGYHLQRILDAEPHPDAGFATDAARWRYEMAVLGPKMEFELLRHRAAMADAKWAQGLGAALPAVRALLPPLDEVSWDAWDGEVLLAALRGAVDARPQLHCRASPPGGDGICELFERGRIPAARAALYGEAVPPRPLPSEQMRAELQAKNPRPETPGDALSQDEWERTAAEILTRCEGVRADRRVCANQLLGAARVQRAGAAAGPDGWSGAYLRRLATLFPTEVAELLWREFRILSDTYDPLLACTVTDATVGGIAKPRGGFRPIVIGRCVSSAEPNTPSPACSPPSRPSSSCWRSARRRVSPGPSPTTTSRTRSMRSRSAHSSEACSGSLPSHRSSLRACCARSA